MNLIEQLQWRYATKKFDSNKLLSAEKVNTLKQAFNLTATSYGLQPIKLVIFSNKKLQQELVKYTMDQQQLSQASHVLVFCIETNIDESFISNYFKRVHQLRNTPKDILAPFKNFLIDDFEKMPESKIQNWATKQAYLAMGNLLTVCAMEKIDACPMEGFMPEKYDEILQLNQKGLKSVLVMPIGFRAKDDMFANFKKVRKEINQSVIEM